MDVHLRPQYSPNTPQLTPPSTSGHVSDQDSMRSGLQSCLEHLDRVHDRMNCVYQEVLEIRARITGLLLTCQTEIVMGGGGILDNSMDFQAIVENEPQTILQTAQDELHAVSPSLIPPVLPISAEQSAFQNQPLNLEYGPLGFSAPPDLPDDNVPQDLLLSGTSGVVVSHGLDAPGFLPRSSNAKTLSKSSGSHDQQKPLSIAKGSQDRVICTWLGCSRAVNQDNLTRHVNEVHWRKVKAACAHCGKGFARPYMLRDHICRGKRRKA
ncbi:uncharacterized protein EDB93DRAFT_1106192 [Suillus bovinus]|uniref:uncharacterized protein n=1 Tax=Suillus bovinus TaxID=48563 RepID=UPI001B8711C1|nr:uncharacterized protein EDB93DRAFT_1106192 [Suillus bovinus]KAG2139083.1 hypothetical protein EDB93DRAFT_1106192 [Suillus bovinus]